MAHPFDVDALIGRPFGDVLDEIAPGWRTFGLGPDGPSGVPVWSLSEGEPRASAEITKATDWQAHSVRGFIATASKKHGVTIESVKDDAGERAYRSFK